MDDFIRYLESVIVYPEFDRFKRLDSSGLFRYKQEQNTKDKGIRSIKPTEHGCIVRYGYFSKSPNGWDKLDGGAGQW